MSKKYFNFNLIDYRMKDEDKDSTFAFTLFLPFIRGFYKISLNFLALFKKFQAN